MVSGIWAIAPLAKDLKNAGNWIVTILGANAAWDLFWEEAIRVVSGEVMVSALDGSRGEPVHVGYPLFERLSRGYVNLVVAVGPAEEGVQANLRLARGVPELELLRVAYDQDVDLLITGSSWAAQPLPLLLLRNITEKVLRNTRRPVLGIRPIGKR